MRLVRSNHEQRSLEMVLSGMCGLAQGCCQPEQYIQLWLLFCCKFPAQHIVKQAGAARLRLYNSRQCNNGISKGRPLTTQPLRVDLWHHQAGDSPSAQGERDDVAKDANKCYCACTWTGCDQPRVDQRGAQILRILGVRAGAQAEGSHPAARRFESLQLADGSQPNR